MSVPGSPDHTGINNDEEGYCFFGSGEMFHKIKTLNWGFTPAAWLLPNAISLKEG